MVLESFFPLILVEGGNDLLRWPLRDQFKLSKLLNLRKPKYISHICLSFTTKFNIAISKDYARKDTTQLRIVLSADLQIQ